MSSRLVSLIRKEFLQFFRDWLVIVLILYSFVEPVLCGLSLSLDVKNMPLVVVDADRSEASRELITKLTNSEYFELYAVLNSQTDLESLFDRGEVRMGLVIPTGFGRDLGRGDTVRVQLIADGSDAFTASVATGYAEQIIGAHSRRIELQRLGVPEPTALARLPVVINQIRAQYDPALRYTHFNMLAMIGITMPFLGIVLGSVAIVREKERGTLEQLLVTPIQPWELIMAKLVPLGLIKMVGLAIGIAIAVWGFGVPVRGSLGLYFALSTLIFMVGAGLGVAVGTVANNMQQALLLSFFLIFPMIFLSGMMVPVDNMPVVLQWLSLLNPLRYTLTITLGVFLKAVGMSVLWPQVVGLAVLGVVIFSASLARFRRSLA
ncbi:MAG: transport permease protein [Chloroflexota bacterium]|nr:MAG: transport permease protein [Chloroflexota bacterium]